MKQFYIWAYGYNSAPTMRTFLGDALWEQSGVEYIGEAWGRTQLLNKGEPLITLHPRVREWIHTGGYARAKHCGAEMVPFPEFSTDYFTVAHYEEWNGYKDVIETSLIETNTAGGTEYLYTYFFVRALGIVQITLWTGQSGYNWVLKSYRRTR